MSNASPVLRVESIYKTYEGSENNARAVSGVSFQIEEGMFYSLLGPSGCGKTTTLRCVAGLEKIDSGQIVLGDTVVSGHSPRVFVRPEDRDIGMVFQSYAVWPHMTVYDNVAFPLRAGRRERRVPRNAVRDRVMEVLSIVQLDGYAERMASKLSGGQQQRLSFARALVHRPKLLLLDEPLSNLDAALRETMRTELRSLQRTLGVTTLYVTHDQSEALSMSNRIAVMNEGVIVQESRPRQLYREPTTAFVAKFVGRTNLLDARVLGASEGGAMRLASEIGIVDAVCPLGTLHNEDVSLSIRPEDILLHLERPSSGADINLLSGTVESVLYLGEAVEYLIRVAGAQLICKQHPDVRLRTHDECWVELPVSRCIVVTDEHGTTTRAHSDDGDDLFVKPDHSVQPLDVGTQAGVSLL